MKKKTKVTLSVLTSLLIGGGIGTAIGYGVWGNHEEKSVETSVDTPADPSAEIPSGSDAVVVDESAEVKPAFRFGLRAEVKRAASTNTITSLTSSNWSNYSDINYINPLVNSAYVKRTATILSDTASESGGSIHYFKLEETDLSKGNLLFLRLRFNSQTKSYPVALGAVNTIDTKCEPVSDNLQGISIYYCIDEEYSGWAKTDRYGDPSFDTDCFDNENTVYCLVNVDKAHCMGVEVGNYNAIEGVDILGSTMLPSNGLTDGQTKDIFVDVDKNYSKDAIISSISAKDLFGQDVPVTVTEGLDTFTPQTIGVYTLKLKATDSYGQTATATLIVHICDYVAPSVTQAKQLTFTADKGQTLKYADLSSYIAVSDNGTSHGSTLTVTYAYDGTAMDTSWTKTFVASDYGTHNVKVTARDGTGNQTEKTFTLKVNDGTAPVIARKDGQAVGSTITIGLSKTFSTSLSDIIQMFKATDNVDGDVSKSLAGVSDKDKNFFANNHKVGSYTLHITAKDKDNNASTQDIPIVISADIPPVFVISDTLVYTDTATPLTTAALAKVVTNGILAKKNVASLSVDASEYIGNEDKPGTYNITYDYTEKEETKSARRLMAPEVKTGSFDLIVKEAEGDDSTKEEENGWTKFWKGVGEFFQKLGNWFRGVFTKFKFDCFITNEDWNLRFGEEGKTETSDKLPAEKASE